MADAPTIYWVEAGLRGRLAVVSRPRGEAHFGLLRAAGVDVLVSLLERGEAARVGLADEAEACARAGIAFVALPVTDYGIPSSLVEMEAAIARLAAEVAAGRGVAAHCFAGLGRSPLLVAGVLIRCGHAKEDAVRRISAARGRDVPEMPDQHLWLDEFAARTPH